MARIDKVQENYERITDKLFADTKMFTDYLKFSGKFFKLPSAQSMAIYGENPNATMVADYDTWKKFGRQVKRGTSSIAVLDNGGLKHFFDISQTAGKKEPYRWTLDKNTAAALIDETFENEGRRFQSFGGCLNFLGAEKAREILPNVLNTLNIEGSKRKAFEKSFISMAQYLIAARCEMGGMFKYNGTADCSALDMLNSKAEKEKLCEFIQITGKSVLISLERSINNIIIQGRNYYGRNQTDMVRGGQEVLPGVQGAERENVQTRPDNVRVSGTNGAGADGRGTGSDERGDRNVRREVAEVYDRELPRSDTLSARSNEVGTDTQTDRQGGLGVSGTSAETVREREPAPDNVLGDSAVGEHSGNDSRQGDNGGHSAAISRVSGADEKSAIYSTNLQQEKAEENTPAFSLSPEQKYVAAKATEFLGYEVDKALFDKIYSGVYAYAYENKTPIQNIPDDELNDVISERAGVVINPELPADLDKIYVDKESETVRMVYYNPDSSAGGQLVYNEFDFDDIASALATDDPIGFLDEHCKQTLLDVDMEGFNEAAREYLNDTEDFNSSDEHYLDKLFALAEPTYSILQLKGGDEQHDYRFAGLEELRKYGLYVDRENYDKVYGGRLKAGETLDDIYDKFNVARPDDFKGHSLSVGDIIEIRQNGRLTANYVDDFGFEEIPDFYLSLEERRSNRTTEKTATEVFKAKTAENFVPINGLSPSDIESDVRGYVQSVLEDNEIDAQIVDLAVVGSRSRNLNDDNSDLDVTVELSSDLKEDALFNILHEQPFDIGGVTVDINPIRAEETGTLGEYLKNAERSILENHERKLAEQRSAVIEGSLQFGLLGNGVTVYDIAKWDDKTNDYPIVAHISNEGNIKFYSDELGQEDVAQIVKHAESVKQSFTESWNKLPTETKYQRILDAANALSGKKWDSFFADKTALTMDEAVKKYEHSLIYGDEELPDSKHSVTAYKVGDFYELFNDDAKIAADLMNLTQTTRSGVPMVGFPTHVFDDYKRNLAMNGYNLKIGDEREIEKILAEGKAKAESKKSVDELKVGDFLRNGEGLWRIKKMDGDFSVSIENTDKTANLAEQSLIGHWKDRIYEQGFEYVSPAELSVEQLREIEQSSSRKQTAPQTAEEQTGEYEGVQLNLFGEPMHEVDIPERTYIDGVDIEQALTRDIISYGTMFRDGKFRVEEYYHEHKGDMKGFAKAISNEYGTGGHSGEGKIGLVSYDSKGVEISITLNNGENTKVNWSWKKVADRIATLIDNGEYITQRDIDERIKDAQYDYKHNEVGSDEYKRAAKVLDNYGLLLDTAPEQTVAVHAEELEKGDKIRFDGEEWTVRSVGDTFISLTNSEGVEQNYYNGLTEKWYDVLNSGSLELIAAHDEPSIENDETAELERAKELINDFCDSEYEGTADFSDLTRVDLAYTEDEETQLPINVYADLENKRIISQFNNVTVRVDEYNSLKEMNDLALSGLNFDELIFDAISYKAPTITCNWSESSVFEENKTYSVAEFDAIMQKADDRRVAGKAAAIRYYGSENAWIEAKSDKFGEFFGYDKTSFTINMPDGSSFTERQDIGDGYGGVIDFLKLIEKYKDIVPLLEKAKSDNIADRVAELNSGYDWSAFTEKKYEELTAAVKAHNYENRHDVYEIRGNTNETVGFPMEIGIAYSSDKWALSYDLYDSEVGDIIQVGSFDEDNIPDYYTFAETVSKAISAKLTKTIGEKDKEKPEQVTESAESVEKPVEVKNLAQLKRIMTVGTEFVITSNIRSDITDQLRQVKYADTTGIYSVRPDAPDDKISTSNRGRGYYLPWGKAADWEFSNGKCTAYKKGAEHTPENAYFSFIIKPRVLEKQQTEVPVQEEKPSSTEIKAVDLAQSIGIDVVDMSGDDNVLTTEQNEQETGAVNQPDNAAKELRVGDKFRDKSTGETSEVISLEGALPWYTDQCTVSRESGGFVITENVSTERLLDARYYEYLGNDNVLSEQAPERENKADISEPHDNPIVERLSNVFSPETAKRLYDAFENSRMADWNSNQAKINRIKKAMYDILGNEEQTEQAFSIILSAFQKAKDFTITDEHLGEGGAKAKFAANVTAIQTLKQIESEGRIATPEEQETLSKYVGWGGIPQAFDSSNAQWAKEYRQLKALLTTDEYSAAKASVLNAHYTTPTVIRAIYNGLQNLGFEGGNILEPAMGIGNFFGAMPEDMRKNSNLSGVELDSITGRIAKQLYPNADVQVKGFENTNYSDNYFDVVVGNVPFGSIPVSDKRYNRENFFIHDYFLAKSLDKVAPGGIIAVVTTKGTLDKEKPRVREYLAKRADLVGAIRLPNNAFKANAGTEVTTDILFLQKRKEMAVEMPDWCYIGHTPDGVPVNNYFVDHPEMILGTMKQGVEFSLYGNDKETACVPIEGANLAKQLEKAVANLKLNNALRIHREAAERQAGTIPAIADVRNFTFAEVEGKMYFRENNIMTEVTEKDGTLTKGKKLERLKALNDLRKTFRDILKAQEDDCSDEKLQELQGVLNEKYDKFVKNYGYINDSANYQVFAKDDDYNALCALEVVNAETKEITKSDIFHRRTIRHYAEITRVETPQDAMHVSIDTLGKLDFGYMSKLCGKEPNEVIEVLKNDNLIYRDPDTASEENNVDGWLEASEYLSGNVRIKLKIAEIAAKDNPDYQRNVDALTAVIPKRIEAGEISARIGVHWVDIDDYRDFFEQYVGIEFHQPMRRTISGEYKIENKGWYGSTATNQVFGTSRLNAYEIFENLLNCRDIVVKDRKTNPETGKDMYVINPKETQLAQDKANRMKERFARWLWEDPERREKYVIRYNELFNSIVGRKFDGSHQTFPGMTPFIKLKPHQLDAIARAKFGGNTLLAHCVGAGKSFEMIAATMEKKRLGLINKACVVVPKNLVGQMAAEWLRLYPQAKILTATEKDFDKDHRQKFIGRCCTGEYDAVIMSYQQFEKTAMSFEYRRDFIKREIATLTEGEEMLKATYRSQQENRGSIKDIERVKKSLEAKLKRLIEDNGKVKDTALSFEQLGFDSLVVDEAHNYKNGLVVTKMNRVAGVQTTPAQKSEDILMKTQYLNENYGEKNIIFATGTPVSNSMVELYVMQRYLRPSLLEQAGLQTFDDWASTFGEVVSKAELKPAGDGYRTKKRFAKFNNLPELMAMYKEFADIRTADMLDLPVPEVKGGKPETIVASTNDFQKAYMKVLSERSEKIHSGRVDAKDDNMLKVTGEARLLGLDARCLNPDAENYPDSKVNLCINKVIEIYTQTTSQKGVQAIFCDIAVNGDNEEEQQQEDGKKTKAKKKKANLDDEFKFSVYNYIKAELIRRGIPKDEICFAGDADSQKKQSEMQAQLRSGTKRIVIASTSKLGTGANIQNKLVALHNLDIPWKPSDLEQRIGRIVRQGNENDEVGIFNYVTKDTFDAYMMNIIVTKQKFISQLMSGDTSARSCEDVDELVLNYTEMQALATGDPRIKEKIELDTDVARLKMLESEHYNEQYRLDNVINQAKVGIENYEHNIAAAKNDVTFAGQNVLPEDTFSIEINGKVYSERKAAGEVLRQAAVKFVANNGTIYLPIGNFRGFELALEKGHSSFGQTTISIAVRHEITYATEMDITGDIGNIARLENLVNDGIGKKLTTMEERLNSLKNDLATALDNKGKPFEHAAELETKSQRLTELNLELEVGKSDEVVIDENEDEDRDSPDRGTLGKDSQDRSKPPRGRR